jgi:DNA transformation protein
MMGGRGEYAAMIVERLAPLGEVTARAMFGGYGVYVDGLIMAIIDDDVLYLKVDAGNAAPYEARGIGPFRPMEGKPAMAYRQVPDDVLEDDEALLAWARESVGAALRSHKGAKAKPKRGAR